MSKQKKKGLRLFDTIAFVFSAVFVLDSFTSAAAVGWQSIIYWIILAVVYFLPYGLISAELSSTYSNSGGIYGWVKRALGPSWASRTNWFYWLNVGVWIASAYILFSATFSSLFFDGNLSVWWQLGLAFIMTWITIGFCILNVKYTKWITNLSSFFKIIFTIGLIAAAITWIAKGNAPATDFTDSKVGIVPSWSQGLVFLPMIVYNLSGFELGANAVGEMKNPKKDIPKATLISGLTIVILYLIGTICINLILDVSPDANPQYDLANGLMRAIQQSLPPWLSIIFGICLMATIFGSLITWSYGANCGIQEAAADKEFPKVFSTLSKGNSPFGAAIIMGIIATVLLIFAGLMSIGGDGKTISGVFWNIYAFHSVIFFLPYLLIFPSFIILRKKDPDIARPYKIKGPKWIIWVITLLPIILIVITLILLLFGSMISGEKTFEWNSGGMGLTFSIIGTVISILIGEIIIYYQKLKNQTQIRGESKVLKLKNEEV